MAVNLSPLGGVGAQFFDSNGNPLSGGLIYTYAAGTSTPAATYTSTSGLIQHSNPIVLDAAGRVPTGEIWLTDGISYKFTIKTSADVLVGTYDNIVGINSNFIAYTAQQEIQTATAGQTVFTLTTMQYQPATNNLSVFVDGVNQYGSGAQYAYVETDATTVTFVSGLHVGASVKFTTASPVSSSSTNAADVAYDPPFTGAVTETVEAKLAQTVSVKDFGAVGDGVTDDTAAIQAALDSGAYRVCGSGLSYLTTATLDIPAGVMFDGENAQILIDGTHTGFETTGDNVTLKDLTIRGEASGVKSGYYGISIVNDNVLITNCTFKDLTYSAIDNSGNNVRVFDVYAENCGWDLIQNFGSPDGVHVHRCHAVRTGRHGFSTDTGAKNIVFEDCIATDIGNPALNEGKDAYHYEGCSWTSIKNCVVNYTANHPATSVTSTGSYNAFREYASVDCVVDGLIVNVEGGFTVSGGAATRLLYVDNATTRLNVSGIVFKNVNTSQVFDMLFNNTNAQLFLEFSNFVIRGPFSWTQQSANGGVRKIANGCFIGTGTQTAINNSYLTENIEIDSVSFNDLGVGIRAAGFRNSTIKNCQFKNNYTSGIVLDWFAYTTDYRPKYGAVMHNYFDGAMATVIETQDALQPITFSSNVLNVTATVGHAAQNTKLAGFGNIVYGTIGTAETGTNSTGAFNSNLNNLASV